MLITWRGDQVTKEHHKDLNNLKIESYSEAKELKYYVSRNNPFVQLTSAAPNYPWHKCQGTPLKSVE